MRWEDKEYKIYPDFETYFDENYKETEHYYDKCVRLENLYFNKHDNGYYSNYRYNNDYKNENYYKDKIIFEKRFHYCNSWGLNNYTFQPYSKNTFKMLPPNTYFPFLKTILHENIEIEEFHYKEWIENIEKKILNKLNYNTEILYVVENIEKFKHKLQKRNYLINRGDNELINHKEFENYYFYKDLKFNFKKEEGYLDYFYYENKKIGETNIKIILCKVNCDMCLNGLTVDKIIYDSEIKSNITFEFKRMAESRAVNRRNK